MANLPENAVGRNCAGNPGSQSVANVGRIDALLARHNGWQQSLLQDYGDQGLKLSLEGARPTPSLTKGGPCCALRHATLRACDASAPIGAARLAAQVATCFAPRYAAPHAAPHAALYRSRRNIDATLSPMTESMGSRWAQWTHPDAGRQICSGARPLRW